VSGKLKVTIVGDSFTEFYEYTYLQALCYDFNVIDHAGFRGGSQYRIYKRFLSQLDQSPDIMICIHTEPSRIYLENLCINYGRVQNNLQKTFNLQKYFAFVRLSITTKGADRMHNLLATTDL
jgi:hypothetical protein